MRVLSFMLLPLLLPTHWAALVVWALVVGSFISFLQFGSSFVPHDLELELPDQRLLTRALVTVLVDGGHSRRRLW